MTKKSKTTDHDSVGYKKPPKATQWQKGQSGNPSGKSNKPDSVAGKLKKLAAKEIIVNQNGSAVVMTQEDTMLQAVFTKAMKGDLASTKFVTEQIGLELSGLPMAAQLVPTEADLAVLQTHADWVAVLELAKTDVENVAASETLNEGDDHDDPDTNN
jgi:hypothetical protein